MVMICFKERFLIVEALQVCKIFPYNFESFLKEENYFIAMPINYLMYCVIYKGGSKLYASVP